MLILKHITIGAERCFNLSSKILGINLYRCLSLSNESFVQISEDNDKKIATLMMMRPSVNSINLEFANNIKESITSLEEKNFKGLILSSGLPAIFSAGIDIQEFCKPTKERFYAFWTAFHDMWKTLYLTPLVTIAAINGHTLGGGCMLILGCDYRIMIDKGAKVGLAPTKLGLSPPSWFCKQLQKQIGYRESEKALFLGTYHSPQAALSSNIIDEMATDEQDLNQRVQNQMSIWLEMPNFPLLQMSKQSLRKQHFDEMDYEENELSDLFCFLQKESTQKAIEKFKETLAAKKS